MDPIKPIARGALLHRLWGSWMIWVDHLQKISEKIVKVCFKIPKCHYASYIFSWIFPTLEPDGCSSGHRLFPVLSTNIASRPLNFQLSRKRLSSCTGVSLGQPVCGLQNVGNQCYMNATLQCLSHTHLLRDIFWNLKSCSPSSSSLACKLCLYTCLIDWF